jgi:hypothetical protein
MAMLRGYCHDMPIPLATQLPYTLHTNRELGLMLANKKPLSHFADGKDCFPDVVKRYLRLFDRHVASGHIIRRDVFLPSDERRSFILHRIFFALPGEEWRIDAMIELMDSPSWGIKQERREGELLGYDDWMNDHFLSICYPDHIGGYSPK